MSADDNGHVWGPREDSGNARGCKRVGCMLRMRPGPFREWQRMPKSPWRSENLVALPWCNGEKLAEPPKPE